MVSQHHSTEHWLGSGDNCTALLLRLPQRCTRDRGAGGAEGGDPSSDAEGNEAFGTAVCGGVCGGVAWAAAAARGRRHAMEDAHHCAMLQ